MGTNGPRWASSYPANVVLVILTLFPGLINTSAIALAAPVIGRDLGVPPDAAASIPLISDAALAFGCVLAAELSRRIESRTLYFVLLAVSLASSLASALAPSFGVLLAAHVAHGLAAGMLFIVVLPPLITNFSSDRLPATASVLVPALFGSVTLGPLLGGTIAAPGIWRAAFAAEVVIALIALVLAPRILKKSEPQGSGEPVDWFALTASATGSLFVYVGIGRLAGHELTDPAAAVPLAAGLLLYALLILVDARKEHPLVPVRSMATSLAIVGTIATVVGSAAFSALTQGFSLTLLRIGELDPRGVGFAFWPEFFTAIASGYVFGRAVTTKWVVLVGAAGLVFIAAAAGAARAVAPVDATAVGWLCLLAGFGAGLSVSPGLFVVTLSFERAQVGRAIALLNLFRLTGGFISAPGVEHTIGSQATQHVLAAAPSLDRAAVGRVVRAFVTGQQLPPGPPGIDALKQALAHAIDDAYLIVVVLALTGVVAIAALLVAQHVPLRRPDLERFDAGQPALESPSLA